MRGIVTDRQSTTGHEVLILLMVALLKSQCGLTPLVLIDYD